MSQELMTIDINQIVVKPGTIVFNEFDSLKAQATDLATQIHQVEVTEDNVQYSKKMLAAVNKRLKEMEDKRISIKKEILSPYNEFEKQVKEIVNIVKDADNLVRDQVRELEEQEREEKRNNIAEIFAKRIKHYVFKDVFGFDDFVRTTHLNKSTSLKLVESEMVEWLEKKDADLKVINSLPNAEEVMTEYHDTKDLTVAINIVNDRAARKKQMEQLVKPKVNTVGQTFIITLSDEKDSKLVEMFMNQNKIQYKIEKVEK
jgi:hypothetical protein